MVIATGLKHPMRTIRPGKIPITYVTEKGGVKFQPTYVFLLILAQGME